MKKGKTELTEAIAKVNVEADVIFFCYNCKNKLTLIDDPEEIPLNISIHQNTMIGYKVYYCANCDIICNIILDNNNQWIRF